MDGRWSHDRTMPQRLRALAARLGSRSRSGRAVLVAAGLVALVLVVAIGLAAMRPDAPGRAASAGEPSREPSTTAPVTPSASPSASPSPSSSPSASSESPKKDDGDGGGDKPVDKPKPPVSDPKPPPRDVTTPSRPTKFGAWEADDGRYTAKWEYPEDDGGSPVTGYVLKKCNGTVLKRVGAGTYRTDILHPDLDCITVQAINAEGEGQTAQYDDILL
ncbi:hypothetical protein Afil01_13090 [Actinorhabdospora filicis]|uniref:Fibronectin type-III domain-containing protein n=1 Tax=Actinorhabdospora filicis TaxID=1785913 RepID=A0A9W6SIL2_9ACTN|nr:fibronectin type III domain-containing protein [Actinorhabdospora filicis]GLZ76502.1 hypothetical protein Afil01_13090 [Actinorhabdospora filicis]